MNENPSFDEADIVDEFGRCDECGVNHTRISIRTVTTYRIIHGQYVSDCEIVKATHRSLCWKCSGVSLPTPKPDAVVPADWTEYPF